MSRLPKPHTLARTVLLNEFNSRGLKGSSYCCFIRGRYRISPSITSTLRIVATPTFNSAAKSSADQRSMARAARIWALDIFLVMTYDVVYTIL